MVLIRNASFPGPRSDAPPAPRPEGDLLSDIRAFLRRHPDITEGVFGRNSCGMHDLITAMKRGRRPREATVAAVRQYMRRVDERAQG